MSEPTKVCSRCKTEKPLEEFGIEKRSSDGRTSCCKECRKKWRIKNSKRLAEDARIYRTNNPELVKESRSKSYRKDIDKSRKRSRENHQKNKEKEAVTHKIYIENHKEEIDIWTKKYREEHKDEIRENREKYNEEHKDEIAEYSREYYALHRDEIIEKAIAYSKIYQPLHMKEVIARTLKYLKTPKGKACMARATHKRRKYAEGQPSTLTNDEWVEIILKQNGKCAHCGRDFSEELFPTRDHIIPVSHPDCTGFVFENVQALCLSCNSRKWSRTEDELEEYLKSTGREKSIYSSNDNDSNNRDTLSEDF